MRLQPTFKGSSQAHHSRKTRVATHARKRMSRTHEFVCHHGWVGGMHRRKMMLHRQYVLACLFAGNVKQRRRKCQFSDDDRIRLCGFFSWLWLWYRL